MAQKWCLYVLLAARKRIPRSGEKLGVTKDTRDNGALSDGLVGESLLPCSLVLTSAGGGNPQALQGPIAVSCGAGVLVSASN